MLHILAFVMAGLANSQPISVTSCGADPTGKLDSTSAFAECLASVPAGTISIPYGTYRLSRPIFKNRNQNLVGMGSNASILLCESANEPCIVAADTALGGVNYNVSRIQDLGLVGPGAANSSIGVLIGGDPAGHIISTRAFGDGVGLLNVRITQFQHGVQWGNNAWGNKILQSAIFGNATGLFVPSGLTNSGEGIGLSQTGIFNNGTGVEDHANFEWLIQDSSFDYNGTGFLFYGATIHASNCHFEQQTSEVFFEPYGYGTLSLKDSEILVQSSSGSDRYILDLWPQSISLSIDDVSIWSNHPIQYFMRSDGNTTGTISNLTGNGNRMIGALAEGATKAVVTAIRSF